MTLLRVFFASVQIYHSPLLLVVCVPQTGQYCVVCTAEWNSRLEREGQTLKHTVNVMSELPEARFFLRYVENNSIACMPFAMQHKIMCFYNFPLLTCLLVASLHIKCTFADLPFRAQTASPLLDFFQYLIYCVVLLGKYDSFFSYHLRFGLNLVVWVFLISSYFSPGFVFFFAELITANWIAQLSGLQI